jgi:hypothetical protein
MLNFITEKPCADFKVISNIFMKKKVFKITTILNKNSKFYKIIKTGTKNMWIFGSFVINISFYNRPNIFNGFICYYLKDQWG